MDASSEDPAGFRASPAFLGFQTPKDCSGPDIDIHWRRVSGLPDMPDEEIAYDPGEVWRIYRLPDGRGWAADIRYSEPRPTARMTVDSAWSNVDFLEIPYPDDSFSPLCYGGMELLIRTRLLDCSGMVFHAAGIDDHGGGVLFIGHSGAGKSTQARIWSEHAGAVIINHDRMALRMTDSGVTAHGLPWGGSAKVTLNRSAPVKAIVLLEQAAENSISSVPDVEAVAELLTCTFLPYWDEARMDRAFGIIQTLVARVPILRLRCRPEPSVIELVRSALR